MASAYWRQHLQAFEPTAFPDLTGLSPNARKDLSGSHIAEGQFDGSLRDLREACSKIDQSIAVLCQAAWLKLLAAYVGEAEVCIGVNRAPTDATLADPPGLCKPLRCSLQASTTHQTLCNNVAQWNRDVQNLDVPTADDVKLACGSDVEAPFDTVVSIRSEVDDDIDDDGVESDPQKAGKSSDFTNTGPGSIFDQYAVVLEIVPRPRKDGLYYRLHCYYSFLSVQDTHLVISALQSAMHSILKQPSTSVFTWQDQLPKTCQSVANPTPSAFDAPFGDLVHSAVEAHASTRPESVALDFENDDGIRTIWTYATLNMFGDKIAQLLSEVHQIQLEDSVPLCVPKSPAFYACILGVLKAGGVFTPFSDAPNDRKKLMLGELRPRCVLYVDGEDMSWCVGAEIVNITSILSTPQKSQVASSHTVAKSEVRGSNLAYQMYTSGSTGRPKAVSIEHRQAVQTASASRGLIPWRTEDRMLQYAAPSFDMCYFDTFTTWMLGLCLCSATSASVFNDLEGVIQRLNVSHMGLTPSVALTLNPQHIPSIKWFYCIGEAMPQSLVDVWEGKLVNSYGPTEAAQMVTLFPVDRNVKAAVIGRSFENTGFTILQKGSNDIAPIFGLGELCISGHQVARGYYANEERTQQSFIIKDGVRMYKTGDNARMLGSGLFEFVGRTDDQVKIRGQRVELGEINSVLQDAHESIKNVTTQILKINDQGRDQLVTFLVVDATCDSKAHSSIREAAEKHACDRLPQFMIPKVLLFIDKILLSAAGKIDKRALAAIFRENSQLVEHPTSHAPASDRDDARRAVRQTFIRASGMSPDEVTDQISMYQLGLDSISAIQMAFQLSQAGYEVQPSDILSHPTIAELSPLLSNYDDNGHSSKEEKFDFVAFADKHRDHVVETCGVKPTDIACIRPCSPLQAGMIAQSVHSEGSMYFNHLTYDLSVDLDMDRLRDAWDVLIERHEILRSGFCYLEDSEYQLAMVTYRARATALPVTFSELPSDIDAWRRSTSSNAIQTLHLPPWLVLVSERKLLFSAHHALYDTQVLELISRDLALAYNGSLSDPAASFEPYLDRILQHGRGQDDASEAFWKDFGERAHVSKFPTMTPLVSEVHTTGEQSLVCTLPLSELESDCRHKGVTMQAVGQAAWGLLLSAYLGQPSVTFGTILGGRTEQKSEDVAFPCITTVPTIVAASGSDATRLTGLMKFNADVQRHQYTSLKEIQRWTGHADDTLFDTLFTLQKRTKSLKVDELIKYDDNDLVIDYPLSVELEPTHENELEIRIYYRHDVIPDQQAELLTRQLDTLIVDMLCHEQRGDKTSLTTADPQLYSICPAKVAAFTSDCTLLHDFVEASAKEHPKKTALEYVTAIEESDVRKELWTFEDLNHEGDRMANLLRSKGVRQGALVAVCFNKCPEASFAMLGILKAGCGLMALDPGAPNDRKTFIMQDSKASLLITKDGAADRDICTESSAQFIDLAEEDLSSLPTTRPLLDRPIDPQECSYCLYTSGTTGTPKGCVITHENVVQAMLTFQQLYKWSSDSRWLAFASYHFDVSIMEQYWSWSVGICCVVASRDLVFEDIAGTLRKLNITHVDLTPSLARVLDPDDVPSLADGVFVTGGEMLKGEIIEKWGETGAIHNAYGPTEATIGCTMYRGVPKNGRPTNIGPAWPIAGTFIVNPDNLEEPVLRGAVGELCITGKLVAKGYLHRPELTKERFITLAGQRAYRTGDLVRILHDGSFDFLGRADGQIKLRGQRLEVGEIDEVIKHSDDAVLDVSTQLLKHPEQQKEQLVSFVVGESYHDKNSSPSIAAEKDSRRLLNTIRSTSTARLPAYMVPTHILPITSLPLSANNKADAKQLKSIYEGTNLGVVQAFAGDSEHDSDLDSTLQEDERKISEALSKVVKADSSDFSRSSSFFELGLDSISVISFARYLKKNGYLTASASIIMRNPTLRRLTKALVSREGSHGQVDDGSIQAAQQSIAASQHRFGSYAASYLSIQRKDIETLAPCTPLQLGIITRSLESSKGLYFASFSFELNHGVDMGRLRTASENVLRKLQILRTQFLPTDDGYIQVVVRDAALPWEEKSTTSAELDDYLDDRHEEWWRTNQSAITRPFEIVVVQTPGCTILSLHVFHACYDGNSLPLLMQCLLGEYHYTADIDYGPSYHEALPYGPLREVDGAQEFWTEQLRNQLSDSRMKSLSPLTATPAASDFLVTSRISDVNGLEACRRNLGVTDQAIIQACWAAVLQTAFEAPVMIGMVVSGRSIDFEGADKVVGPLFNTIPFAIRFQEEDTWKSAVQRCHEFNTAALLYQHTALRDIHKWTTKYRKDRQTALFDTLFVFQKELPSEDRPDPIWTPQDEDYEADYPLSLEVVQTVEGELDVTLGTQAHMSNHEASMALVQKLESTLRSLIGDVESRVTSTLDVPTLSQEVEKDASQQEQLHGHQNGHSNGYLNGHTNGASKSSSEDNWSTQATRVREVVADLAGADLQSLTPDTSILELGLDSIDAVKLSSRLRRTCELHIAVSSIMRALTISKIAEAATRAKVKTQSGAAEDSRSGLDEALTRYFKQSGLVSPTFESVLPCTPLQEGMVLDMINSDFSRYLNHAVLRLSEGVDVGKLKTSWRTVIEATPILRTRFQEVSDPDIACAIAQLALTSFHFPWSERSIDKDIDVDAVLQDIQTTVKAEVHETPAIRLTLIRRGATGKPDYLILSIAHAMYDGWSLGLLHEDVDRVYHGSFKARPSFAPALHKILEASNDKSEAFWRESLSESVATNMPQKQVSRSEAADLVHREESSSTIAFDEIQDFCKTSRVTVSALVQTVWSCVLAHHTRQLDVAFGQVLSGRDDEDSNEVAFPTMNTVISRAVLHGSRVDMVRYMQDNMSSNTEHQHFPLRKALALADAAGKGSLFNTLFIYQKSPVMKRTESEKLYEIVDGSSNVEYPVCVEAEVTNDALIWRTACQDGYIDQKGALGLLKHLDEVLRAVIRSPQEPIVVFRGGQVSVCGLTPFTQARQQQISKSSTSQSRHEDDMDDSSWSPIAQQIRVAVAQVARVESDRVRKQSSLMSLGLDSISAIKVSSLLRKQSIRLTVSDLLKAGTIATMAEVAERAVEAASGNGNPGQRKTSNINDSEALSRMMENIDKSDLLSGTAADVSEAALMPASAGQILMLSRWQNHGTFFPTLYFDITGCDDMSKLQQAWDKVLSKAPIFRTVFIATGRSDLPIVQAQLRSGSSSVIEVPDSMSLDESIARQTRDRDTRAMSPPIRLFAKKSHGKALAIAFHLSHALYDGFVLPTLVEQLRRVLQDPSAALDASELTCSTYLARTFPSAPARKEFWTSYLSGLHVSNLSLKQLRSEDDDSRKRNVHVVKPNIVAGDAMTKLDRLRRSHQLTIQSLFLAAYAKIHAVLAIAGNESAHDILLGVYVANRAMEGAEDLMAPTIGFVPVRVRKPLERSVLDVAKGVQDDLRAIGEDGRGCVGLWELDAWVKEQGGDGVKVDVWVNILRSWEEDGNALVDTEDSSDAPENAITIQGSEHGAREVERADVNEVTIKDEDPSNGLLLMNNAVRHLYGPAIDLEATMHSDSISISVLAPEELLDLDDAGQVIENLANGLREMEA